MSVEAVVPGSDGASGMIDNSDRSALEGMLKAYPAEQLVDEVGSANLFAVEGNVLKTPQLGGSILPGVTRDSVIKLASEILKLDVHETDLTVEELLNANEVFCTGTAVVVTPIGKISTNENEYVIGNGEMGSITAELRNLILNIRSEVREDIFGWLNPLKI